MFFFFFLRFCRTWTKRYLSTSAITRLIVVCKVNRCRLVQVRQSLKKDLLKLYRNRLSPSDFLSFFSSSYMLRFFLKSILCDVKMRSVAVSHRVTTRKCGYKATTLGDCSFPWKLEVPELAQKTLLLVKNGRLLRKTTAILFSLRASWIECENKILFIPKWQRISFFCDRFRDLAVGPNTSTQNSKIYSRFSLFYDLSTKRLWKINLRAKTTYHHSKLLLILWHAKLFTWQSERSAGSEMASGDVVQLSTGFEKETSNFIKFFSFSTDKDRRTDRCWKRRIW